jgi:outer membrane protein OmpA-like peptidoglycan-associated protein
MTGGHRDGTWELTASAGVVATDKQFNVKQFAPGGTLRVGYNINKMWNISVGSGIGFPSVNVGSGSVTLIQPFAAITWTPDINKTTSPFITVGGGGTYARYSFGGNSTHITAQYGGHVGVGIRHMIGENLALRVEGREQYEHFEEFPNAVFNGTGTVGLSLFVGARKILTSIAVTPATPTLNSLRQTQQLSATARDQRGNPMTGKVFRWTSSNPAVATVSPTGMVTAVGNGTATITAASENVTGTANLTVAQAAATVTVAPASATMDALGATQQLTAAARDANNNPFPGAAFTWTSSDPAVATVSPSGAVTSVGNGTARLTASSSGKSAVATVTVAQMTASVAVTPPASTISAANGTAQLMAQATDANGRPVAGKTFTWTSDAASVATVSGSGLATAVGNGTAHITASADGKTASAMVTVVIGAPGLPAVNATMVMRNVNFRPNRAVLLPAARTELDKVASAIKGTPGSRWEIAGYTSSVGAAARNLRLSQQRADAVKTYLESKGVPAASLTAVGRGAQDPIASNRTAAGRRQNMRVEIKRLQ